MTQPPPPWFSWSPPAAESWHCTRPAPQPEGAHTNVLVILLTDRETDTGEGSNKDHKSTYTSCPPFYHFVPRLSSPGFPFPLRDSFKYYFPAPLTSCSWFLIWSSACLASSSLAIMASILSVSSRAASCSALLLSSSSLMALSSCSWSSAGWNHYSLLRFLSVCPPVLMWSTKLLMWVSWCH